jgi:hypothetical protein
MCPIDKANFDDAIADPKAELVSPYTNTMSGFSFFTILSHLTIISSV